MSILNLRWIVITLVLAFYSNVLAGWAITYGKDSLDYKAVSVDLTSDGGYIVTVWTMTGNSMVLLKVDSRGIIKMKKEYVYHDDLGNQTMCFGSCVRQTRDGGYIVCGTRNCDGSTNFNLWLMKTDGEGKVLWEKFHDGPYSAREADWGYSIKEVSTGGYIVAGETFLDFVSFQFSDVWLVRMDENGDTLWTEWFGSESTFPEEFGWDVLETPDGGFAFTGTREDNFFLIKTDASGDTVLSKIYASENIMHAVGRGLALCPDGGYVMAVEMLRYDDPWFCGNIWLFKMDSLGKTLWMKRYGEDSLNEKPYGLERTSDGGYAIVGCKGNASLDGDYSMDLWLLKTDSLGDTLWTRTYGGPGDDYGRSVRQTPDGGYVIAGYTNSFGSGWNEYWLIKTDSLGLLGITEPSSPVTLPPSPVTHLETASPIGSEIVLRYSGCPRGFRASVFDASGRKVDEITSPAASGTIEWGGGRSPGVYFIVPQNFKAMPSKVVLVK